MYKPLSHFLWGCPSPKDVKNSRSNHVDNMLIVWGKVLKAALLTSCLLLPALPSFAQQSDYQQIETTLNYYLEGGTQNEFETLAKAFHPTATMKFVGEAYKEVNALDFFQKGMKPGPPQNRNTRILSISISGNAAAAQLEIIYPTFTFIDHMQLLKIEGKWLIVSKVFYNTKPG